MIDPKATVSYAQYNEDIILDALFVDVKKGFYVDVGANYPTIDSVTKRFYDKGWSGVNIEPLRSLHQQLEKERKRDINLCYGLSDKKGVAKFTEYPGIPGHSTFDRGRKAAHKKNTEVVEYEVEVHPLRSIFEQYCPDNVNFIKIDVEGYENQVVIGNDWRKYRPEVACIEANHAKEDWKDILMASGYRLFIHDSLNEYYVAEESWGRTKGFEERVIEMSYHSLRQHQYQSWKRDSELLATLSERGEEYEKRIKILNTKVHELENSSYKGKRFLDRLKLAGESLTTDFIRQKRGQ